MMLMMGKIHWHLRCALSFCAVALVVVMVGWRTAHQDISYIYIRIYIKQILNLALSLPPRDNFFLPSPSPARLVYGYRKLRGACKSTKPSGRSSSSSSDRVEVPLRRVSIFITLTLERMPPPSVEKD